MAKNKLLILLIIFTFTQNAYSSNQQSSGSSNQINPLQNKVDDWYKKELMPHFMLEGLSNNKEYLYSTIKNLKESAVFFAQIPEEDPCVDKVFKDAHPFLLHCTLSMFPYGCTPLILNQKITPIAFVLFSLKRAQLETKCNIKIDTMQTLFIAQLQTSHLISKIIEEDIQTREKMRLQENDFSSLIKGSKQKNQQPPTKCMLEHQPFLTLKVRILNFIREHNYNHPKDKQINTALLRSIHPHVFNYPRVVDPAFEQRLEKICKLEEKKHTVHEPTNPIDLAAQYGFYISDDDDQDTANCGLKTKNSVLGFYVSDDDE